MIIQVSRAAIIRKTREWISKKDHIKSGKQVCCFCQETIHLNSYALSMGKYCPSGTHMNVWIHLNCVTKLEKEVEKKIKEYSDYIVEGNL